MEYATLVIDESAMIGIPETPRAPRPRPPPYRSFSQTMASPAEVLRQLYSRYLGALQGASDFLRDDLPSASPGVAKWAQETGRRACRKYARQRGSIPFLTSDPSWDGICSGYWEAINEGPTSGGSYGPLYPGGRCNTAYLFDVREQSFNGDTGEVLSDRTDTFGPYQGPLTWSSLPDLDTSSVNQKRVLLTYTGGSFSIITSARVKLPLRPDYGSNTISNIRRVDGQPDNCGNDPNNTYRPPTFPPNLPPLPTTPTNPAPGFGNNWDVDILPDGQVSICISGECSTGTPPGGGGGPDSGGGPGEPDGDPKENDPNDPNDPQEITGCVEDGNLLTGLKIEILETPNNSSGSNGVNYRVAWIYMGPDSDKLDLVSDGKTLEDGQFIIPDSTDCTCYKVRMNLGWGLRVQAFSRPKEE